MDTWTHAANQAPLPHFSAEERDRVVTYLVEPPDLRSRGRAPPPSPTSVKPLSLPGRQAQLRPVTPWWSESPGKLVPSTFPKPLPSRFFSGSKMALETTAVTNDPGVSYHHQIVPVVLDPESAAAGEYFWLCEPSALRHNYSGQKQPERIHEWTGLTVVQ